MWVNVEIRTFFFELIPWIMETYFWEIIVFSDFFFFFYNDSVLGEAQRKELHYCVIYSFIL